MWLEDELEEEREVSELYQTIRDEKMIQLVANERLGNGPQVTVISIDLFNLTANPSRRPYWDPK